MFCPKCGTEDINGATFCGACGYKLQQPVQAQPVQQMAQPVQAQPVEQVQQPVLARPMRQIQQPTHASPIQQMQQPVEQVQQPALIQPMQQALQASINQYTQPRYNGNAPKRKNKGGIILMASLVGVVVAAIAVILFILLGSEKSFIGNWEFEGFVAEGGETLYIDELQNIEDQTMLVFLKDRFLESELSIKEDGVAEFRSATENESGTWKDIDEDWISVILFNESCKATIEEEKLMLIAGKTLYLTEFDIVGVLLKEKEEVE